MKKLRKTFSQKSCLTSRFVVNRDLETEGNGREGRQNWVPVWERLNYLASVTRPSSLGDSRKQGNSGRFASGRMSMQIILLRSLTICKGVVTGDLGSIGPVGELGGHKRP